jgi:large subunit ribosomal protein L18
MTNRNVLKRNQRLLRKSRVRSVVSGTTARPRLSIFRSAGHIYAQLIDDTKGTTLAAASSKELKTAKTDKKVAGQAGGKVAGKIDRSTQVGKLIAGKAKEKGINAVVFDRGGYRYMGRVKALADGAREGGLQF